MQRVRASLEDGTFAEIRLRPDGGDGVTLRRVALKAGPALAFVTHEERSDRTRNVPLEHGLNELAMAVVRPGSAWLSTGRRSWQLVVPARGPARCVVHRVAARSPPDAEHDEPKRHHLGDGATDWLRGLDLVDERGRPRPSRVAKLRQIERYADLLTHLVPACGWRPGATLQIADMGCGKGYLTFAAWHVLRRQLGFDARLVGVDAQAGVIESSMALARRVGAAELDFRIGTILDAHLPRLDALMALHACNDATDHALLRGVNLGAKLIVVAPCCHKDLRRQLGDPPPLAPVLEHGLFKEHFAQWLTDGLRTLAMEAAGYRVRVAEFVAPEHTPRNTLLAGIHQPNRARQARAAQQYRDIKAWAGLASLAIDALLLPQE